MAKKNPDLSQALKTLDNRAAPDTPKPAPIERTKNTHYRPSRQGMENLTGNFPPEVIAAPPTGIAPISSHSA